jgi:5-methylcytosine rRNA methyltransferase NSUN4
VTRLHKGKLGFESYYAEQFGARWMSLKEALERRNQNAQLGRVVRENQFADPEARQRLLGQMAPGLLPGTRTLEGGMPEGLELYDARDDRRLCVGYVMDPASMLAAHALDVSEASSVLDLCAAPGGKSLVLLERLRHEGTLLANDRSKDRLGRLQRVFGDYVPAELLTRVKTTCMDGRKMGMTRRAQFDRVLLDAPCSSEGHVLGSERALDEWSETRVTRLAQDQYALLTSALLALESGGKLVYSTCALTRAENDGVIDRLLDKARHPVRVLPLPTLPFGSPTDHGVHILPDEAGFGPTYFAVLQKEG